MIVVIGFRAKKLSEKKREYLSIEIRQHALTWSIAQASVEEIDRLNILQATFLAMRRAVGMLAISPEKILVDGNQSPGLGVLTETVVNGDALIPAISAASILAKVARDAEMQMLHALHPAYGLAQHKGFLQ